MGTSHGDFFKYPRTPHLVGSSGTSDDRKMNSTDTRKLLADPSLIIEEKIDGTNVGLHFAGGELILQCRGHEITAGMHPQYDLFKQWATVKQDLFARMLGDQYIIYGEWMYAKHCIHYRELPHYFFEFDILDKATSSFLTIDQRYDMLDGTGVQTVPIIHRGPIAEKELGSLIGASSFGAEFENPLNGMTDNLMEGLYLRAEDENGVTARAKMVRPEFVEKIKLSQHWQYEKMIPNELDKDADIWK